MMELSVALVFTVGGIVGSILITQMWQLNYFKRENFKFNLSQKRKENTINFKKLERDLGLKQVNNQISPSVISDLAEKFIGGDEGNEITENPVINGIINYATSHPEVTDKILKQVGIGGKEKDTDEQIYEN